MNKTLPKNLRQESSSGFSIFGLFLCFLFSLHMLQASAGNDVIRQDETKEVTGIVTDANTKEPLPGVSIQIKGTLTGATTDIEGRYSITVSPNDILVFSYVGYMNEEIMVGNQTEIIMLMVPDIIGLEEVVVVGYGVQKKKLVTGATTQVKNEDLVRNNVNRLESSLQGLTPGMVIVKKSGQPGSDYNINIRGLGSVNGSTPLVLIDGVPGNLNILNPSDVESVDILKDAASAAIYGSRAADGVILITTKKGKSNTPQLTYDFYYGISNAPRKIEVLNAQEYAMIQNEGYFNNTPSGTRPYFTEAEIDSINSLGHTGTDWQEEAYRKNAPTQNHYLGLSGGNEHSTYSVSLSYTSEKGIFDYDDKSSYERLGFRLNSEHKIKKFLKIGENLTFAHRNQSGLGVGNIYDNFMRTILSASPLIDVYDPNQNDGFGKSNFNIEQVNPIAVMHYQYNSKNKYDDLIGNVYAEIEILKGLKFRTDFGGSLYFTQTTSVTDTFQITPDNKNEVPDLRQFMERRFSYNFDNVLSYEKTFGRHNVLAMVGMNAQDNWFYNMEINANGFLANPNLDPVMSNIAISPEVPGDTITTEGDYGKLDSYYSYFGRLSYNFDEKYLLTVSLRRDGSSRFGKNEHFGYFPAVSAGWVISRENFAQSATSWLNFLKIRASWGQNGKVPDLSGRHLATVGTYDRSYSFGSGRIVGMSPDVFPNPYLKWEASTQTDIGFDSRFLNGVSLNFDWYRETSKDWIVPKTVASISGSEGISTVKPYINGGNVTNTGIEVELGYTKNLSGLLMNVRANMAYNKNTVTEVPNEIIHGSVSVLYNGSDEFYRVEEGFPIGYFWGYRTDGLFQTQEEVNNYVNTEGVPYQKNALPGDVKRIDENGDGTIDNEDKVMLGDPNPDFIYGFTIDATYKGFDFSMNIQGVAGNQIVQAYRAEERTYFNYTAEALDRWQWVDANENGVVDAGEGTSDVMPRITLGSDRNRNWKAFSDLFVKDAGYLKIKSINLGYDFKTLFKGLPLQQLRIYVAATNLLTITKYDGLDPEVGYGSYYDGSGRLTDAYASGVDIGFYPAARTYLIGANVKF
ncbi:MAG: TonB-dependent receptor [Bacteroidales bacterium]|nr:TonB-dependent receptor [Bacteroidales bacterium]MBN2764692.1 TonB-dependent receptor [Bacteroidales bacterium]